MKAPEPGSRRVSRASVLPVLLLLASAVAMASLALAPRDKDLVAAVFPPGTQRDRILERLVSADAALVRFGAWEWIAVVASPQAASPQAASPQAELAARLRAVGAWLVLDPIAAGGCQAPSPSQIGG